MELSVAARMIRVEPYPHVGVSGSIIDRIGCASSLRSVLGTANHGPGLSRLLLSHRRGVFTRCELCLLLPRLSAGAICDDGALCLLRQSREKT